MINIHVLYTPKGEMHLDQATAMELSLLGVIESYDRNYINLKVLVTSYRPVGQAQPADDTKRGDFHVGDIVRSKTVPKYTFRIEEDGYTSFPTDIVKQEFTYKYDLNYMNANFINEFMELCF